MCNPPHVCECVCVCYSEMKLPTAGLLSSTVKHILLLVSRVCVCVCDVVFHCIVLKSIIFPTCPLSSYSNAAAPPSECVPSLFITFFIPSYQSILHRMCVVMCCSCLIACQDGKCVTLFADRVRSGMLTAKRNKKKKMD